MTTAAAVAASTSSIRRREVDWEAAGGKLIDWDDGHVPENLTNDANANANANTQLLLTYPDYYFENNNNNAHVLIFDAAVEPALVDALYQVTVEEDKPWGTYVTLEQILQANSQQHQRGDASSCLSSSSNNNKDDLALCAATGFLHNATTKEPTKQYDSDTTTTDSSWHYYMSQLQEQAHGVAVWALPATEGSQVPYHLDYAEQIRYETNVIVPPVLAGTLQCTQGKLKGGDFCVHLDGLEHYKKHGYKGAKEEIDMKDEGWLQVPYRYNRMICTTGHLPHLSSTIEALPTGCKRVIVGFNVFLHDVGPIVQEAPEHSDAFRRKVAVQRMLSQNSKRRLSLQTVQSSPGIARLLIRAKREKAKQDFVHAQQELDHKIQTLLLNDRSDGLTVGTLMRQLGRTNDNDGAWPSPVDVQVHIYHRWREGGLQVLVADEKDEASLKNGGCDKKLVSPDWIVRLSSLPLQPTEEQVWNNPKALSNNVSTVP